MSSASVVMVLTPSGSGAIAVVRIAGPLVAQFLQSTFSRNVVPARCVHGQLSRGGAVLDDPVVVLSKDRRYADICIHGGMWLVEATVQVAVEHGFERVPAASAVYSFAELESDDELEREFIEALPRARTELALRVLLEQRECWARLLGGPVTQAQVDAMLADQSLIRLLCPPRVAIVGIPNVGKSTLANQLFAQDRSITADMPGTTRDWVGELANLDGLVVELVDTPGQRATSDQIERRAIEQSQSVIDRAKLVLLVLDSTVELEPEQSAMIRKYSEALVILNKVDQTLALQSARADVRTVATTGHGIDALRELIRCRLLGRDYAEVRARVWTKRQRQLLESRASTANSAV